MSRNADGTLRKEFLANTLSSIGDGVIATDQQRMVLYINPTGEKLTGWSKEEATTMPFGQVFCIIDYSTCRLLEEPIRPVLKQGRTVGLQNRSALITEEVLQRSRDGGRRPGGPCI